MLAATAVGALVGAVAVARLALVVSATPPDAWLLEIPSLLQPQAPIDEGTRDRAAFAARFLSDPALVIPLLRGCDDEPAGAGQRGAHCLAVINDGLAAAPYSGELWFGKALWLLKSGTANAELVDALRKSYLTAPKEGWIASGRVVFGLRLFPLLPTDLQAAVERDLDLVLDYSGFSVLLADAYAADSALRAAAKPALERLTPERLKVFTDRVLTGVHSAN